MSFTNFAFTRRSFLGSAPLLWKTPSVVYICTGGLGEGLLTTIQGWMAHHGRTIVGVLDPLVALAGFCLGSLSGGIATSALRSYDRGRTWGRGLSALQHRERGSTSNPDTRGDRRFADQRLRGRVKGACMPVPL